MLYAAPESMNGARFVSDELEQLGWQVTLADEAKVKGLAPLAATIDRIDAFVRAERERARFRLHLVRHRAARSLAGGHHRLPASDRALRR